MTPGEASPKLPLRLIVLLALAHTGFTAARLALTLQAVHLQASPLAIGVIMSLLMAVPMVVAVPIGRWADRVGVQPPAACGFAMMAAAGLLAAVHPALWSLGVASVLVGTGFMLAHVPVNNAIGHAAAPHLRSQAFAALALGLSASGLSGPLLAGAAIDFGGHALAFGLAGLLPVVSALLLVWPSRLASHARPPRPGAAPGNVADLLRHPRLRAVLLVSGAVSMGWDLFTFLVPLHAARVGLSASATGLVVGMFGAGTFAVRLAMPRLLRSVAEWRLLSLALLLAALLYLGLPFLSTLATLLPFAFALGMVLGSGQPLAMGLLHQASPEGRSGEAVGLRATIVSLSQTLLPLLFGALGAATGLVPVFWSAAAALAGGGVYAGRRQKG